MIGSVTPGPHPRGILSARRFALLAGSILGLGAAALIVTPDLAPQKLPSVSTLANAQNLTQQAQTVARPVGFADIVEKVKPAVVSVRVKRNGGAQLSNNELPFPPGSPLERFFREFGMPNMPNMPNTPNSPRGNQNRGGGGQLVMGQGF